MDALLEFGYGDARRADLPLIVQGGHAGVRGARATRELSAVDGTATRVDKTDVGTFWSAITAAGSAGKAGTGKVWLDGKRRPLLDRSVSQVGAPTAWQAGYTGAGVTVAVLDSGVDATHPDLAGKVVEAKNFTDDPNPADTVGHGTHVASTIVATAAASNGRYRGVAPDAMLLDGKVCMDGWCPESAILASGVGAAVPGLAHYPGSDVRRRHAWALR